MDFAEAQEEVPLPTVRHCEVVRSIGRELAEVERRRMEVLKGFAVENRLVHRKMKSLLVDRKAMQVAAAVHAGALDRNHSSVCGLAKQYLCLLEDDGFSW